MELSPVKKTILYDANARYFGVKAVDSDRRKEKIGIGQVKVLKTPAPSSHKGDNGKLLIIGGSQKYHGAPLLAAKIASKIVDLVYFSSTAENNELLKKMKSRLGEFIAVPQESVFQQAKSVDAILIGPGIDVDPKFTAIINGLLRKFPKKKFVLDAGAFKMVDKKLLNKNCLLTPHHGEFRALFKKTPNPSNLKAMARQYNCIIVLKGPKDLVAAKNQFQINDTGNSGMTKGGTGDVLAGLIAALSCQNDLFLSASAGVFINGLAGDRLYRKEGFHYNASDLIAEIPKTVNWCRSW